MTEDRAAPEFRKAILFLRRLQPTAERSSKSQTIFEKWRSVFSSNLNLAGCRIALYRSLSEEVDLSSWERFFRSKQALLFFPRVPSTESSGSKNLEMVRVSDSTILKKGVFGIEEPVGDDVLVDPEELDIVFVPGLVFGPKGERIGMGAGFYDRFLSRNDRALRVSLAFDFQCGEKVPQNPWDQRVDWLLTEIRETRGEHWSERMNQLKGRLRKESSTSL